MCTARFGLESILGKSGPVSLSVDDGDRKLLSRTDLRRKPIVLTGTIVKSKLKRFFKREGAPVSICQKQ